MERLANILNQELEVFNRFLVLLDQQHKQIINKQLEELNNTSMQLDLLTGKIRHLESRRMKAVNKIAGELDLAEKSPKLRDILPHLRSDSSNRLHLLRKAILSAHKQAEEKSLRNKRLCEKSRRLIADSMQAIAKQPSPVFHESCHNRPAMSGSRLVKNTV